jgi:hypothetical protein
MTLPREVEHAISMVCEQRPLSTESVIVRQIIEVLTGENPTKLLEWMEVAGGYGEFVRELSAAVRGRLLVNTQERVDAADARLAARPVSR